MEGKRKHGLDPNQKNMLSERVMYAFVKDSSVKASFLCELIPMHPISVDLFS